MHFNDSLLFSILTLGSWLGLNRQNRRLYVLSKLLLFPIMFRSNRDKISLNMVNVFIEAALPLV